MPRPRTNDPLGIPKKPNPTTDPARLEELLAEVDKRIDYLTQSYQIANYALKNDKAFNESLARLKRSLNRKRKAKHRGERLHPEVEMVISTFAREIVNGDETRIDQQVIEQAAWQALGVLKLRRRPANRILRHHVAGVMALVHSFSGKPVLARRYRDMDDYQPHFVEGASQIIPAVFQGIDPNITVTELVDKVLDIRREYAGRELHFEDLFPGYGAKITDDFQLQLRPGRRLERFEANIPIYCP